MFEKDLAVHALIENHVLIPRALELEKKLTTLRDCTVGEIPAYSNSLPHSEISESTEDPDTNSEVHCLAAMLFRKITVDF